MINISKKLTLVAALSVLTFAAAPAQANDMVNNVANSFVGGDVNQHVIGDGNINVGSIDTNQGFSEYNQAHAAINGGINQDIRHGVGDINVGSLKSDEGESLGNQTSGYIEGEVNQFVDGGETEINVGSIDNSGNFEFTRTTDNFTEAQVLGHINQYAGEGSNAKLNLGSIK